MPDYVGHVPYMAGYITDADLQRVLHGFGQPEASGSELHAWLKGAAGYDREGRRVTFGNFVRMMGHTVKQSLPRGMKPPL